MVAINELEQVAVGWPEVEFCCVHCGAGLRVPRALAGIEGPCPRCRRPTPSPRFDGGEGVRGVGGGRLAPEPRLPKRGGPVGRLALEVEPIGEFVAPEAVDRGRRGFVAKQKVEKVWDPGEEWREMLRERRRRAALRERRERKLVAVLGSPAFRAARTVLSVVALVVVVGTLGFMKFTDWGNRRPEWVPAPRVGAGGGRVVVDVEAAVPGAAGAAVWDRGPLSEEAIMVGPPEPGDGWPAGTAGTAALAEPTFVWGE